MHALSSASDILSCEHCFDDRGSLQAIQMIQGRIGEPGVDPTYFALVKIPYRWKHFCATFGELITTGRLQKEDSSPEVPAVNPLEGRSLTSPILVPNGPRKVHHWHSRRPDYDALYVIDLQNRVISRTAILPKQSGTRSRPRGPQEPCLEFSNNENVAV